MKRFKHVILLWGIFTILLLPAAPRQALAEELEKVSIQLRWMHEFQFAGYYAAIAKGYYKEEGLDVTLYEQSSNSTPTSQVVNGITEYGVADAGLLLQRITGKPVVLLTQIFQHSPLIFITRQDSGIISPYEMAGKTVMMEDNRDSASLNAMLADTLGKDFRSIIKQVPHSRQYDALVRGKADVVSAYLTSQPLLLKQEGVSVNIINPQNYGIDFYGDNLFTSEQELQDHPLRVEKMVRATLKGWQYALNHPNEIISLILKEYNSQHLDRQFLEYEAKMTKTMIMPDIIPLGKINKRRYQRVVQTYQRLGFSKKAIIPEGFIYQNQIIQLSKQEQQWLDKHRNIRIGIDPNWPPIEFIDDRGQLSGMTKDYMALLHDRLPLNITLQPTDTWAQTLAAARNGTIDMAPVMVETAKRRKLFNFTKPYLEYPVVILAHQDAPYIGGMEDLQHQRLAVVAQFSLTTTIEKEYPGYDLTTYPDISQALTALSHKKVDALVANTASVSHLLKRPQFSTLKIVAPTPYIDTLSFGVRKDWPELIPILEKWIDALSEEEQQAIERSWVNMQVEQQTNWQLIGYIGVAAIIIVIWILLFFGIINKRLHKEVERRTAALTASERKFKSIFNNTYSFIGLLDIQGVLLESNNTSLAFIGKETEDVVGQLFWDTPWWNFSDKSRNDIKDYIHRAMEGEVVNVDVIHQDPHKKPHYINFSVKPIYDDDGKVVFLVAEGRDISRQKLDELRYRTLFETASDAILILKDERFIECNPKALEIFGCDIEQIKEMTPYQLSPAYQPDGRDSKESALEKINMALTGNQLHYEWQHHRCDGSPFDSEVSLNVIEFENERYLQTTVRDITERKNTEKQISRLVSAIEQSAETIVLTDTKGIIEYVNPAFEKVMGYSRKEVINTSTPLITQAQQQDPMYKQLLATISAGKTWEGRLTNLRKDGSQIIEEGTISPVLNITGEHVGYVSVKRDITEQIRLEGDLRQAQKMEAVGTLAGGIAHDFNNILTAIFGYTDLALMHTDNIAKLEKDLSEVRQATIRARDLVKQILAFSRKSEQAKQPLQIALIVKEVVKLLRSSIPSTIEIKQQILAANETVLADPTQIHQIVMNLCTNAYQAMRKTGGVLGISLRNVTIKEMEKRLGKPLRPKNYLELEITDTGSGMSPATIDKIFEPYFTTKEMGEGTGLGLAVVHGIIQDHQGIIHVESEQGKGTVFTIYLPTTNSEETENTPHKKQLDINHNHSHIMLVDDEENILDIGRHIFEMYGYQISTFNNPSEALSAFNQDPTKYDLLITDMTMPEMTGMELAGMTMKIRADLPVILCTGYSDLINQEAALLFGIKEYMAKPLSMVKLVATVQRILAKTPKPPEI